MHTFKICTCPWPKISLRSGSRTKEVGNASRRHSCSSSQASWSALAILGETLLNTQRVRWFHKVQAPRIMRELSPFRIRFYQLQQQIFFPTYQQENSTACGARIVADHLQNLEPKLPGKHTGQEVVDRLFILTTMRALDWIWKVSCARRTAVQHLQRVTSHKMKWHLPGPNISKLFPTEETLVCCLSGVMTISREMWNLRVLRTRLQGHLRKEDPNYFGYQKSRPDQWGPQALSFWEPI